MAKKIASKRLVIDASIARAAGGRENPTSQRCTSFLTIVRDEGHRMVMTPDIYKEWQKHEARFAYRWRTSMVAQKQMAHFRTEAVFDQYLRDRIDQTPTTDKDRREMLKDVHLLEAAIATDRIVTSLNERDRNRFASICDDVPQIRDVVWANPDKPEEQCIGWLKSGAPTEEFRQLGYTRK
jgi:hypothetical protein